MVIVPAGKMRLMIAQNVANPLLDSSPGQELGAIGDEQIPDISPDVGMQDEITPQEVPENDIERGEIKGENGGNKTLSDYVFKKLESFGYPPRRLEEFKKEFVNQDISPDGTQTIKIVIPDKYYPSATGERAKTVEGDYVTKEFAPEVNRIFGLNFNGAHRADGKWEINFTSAQIQQDEDQGVGDNLDEVYGVPQKGKPKTKPGRGVRAFTLEEMMKESKNSIIDKLRKLVNGDKDAS